VIPETERLVTFALPAPVISAVVVPAKFFISKTFDVSAPSPFCIETAPNVEFVNISGLEELL